MGKQRKKTLQELMQERATGTGNQSVYTTEPRKTYGTSESVKTQVDNLYKRNQTKPTNTWDKVVNKYNEIKSGKVGYIGRSFGAGIKSGVAGIGQGILTDVASQMQKGEEKKTSENIKELVEATTNPKMAMLNVLSKTTKENAEILKDKDKGFLEKIGGVITNTTGDVSNALLPRKTNNR